MAQQPGVALPARPFLKWAGGKTQLLDMFDRFLPAGLGTGAVTRFVEPFVGGGAVFFSLNQRFSFNRCCISDANAELILLYRVIRRFAGQLIPELETLESEYCSRDDAGRKAYYYEVRDAFNRAQTSVDFRQYGSGWIQRAAQIIFLNRTCYNGLFRVNRNGIFNVPFGRYKKPDILNAENLRKAAGVLDNTTILSGDFTKCRRFVDDNTFVYLDPPYRPLNKTSAFTSYSRYGFSDRDQVRLARFFAELDAKGAMVMLSNSDPKNEDPSDTFFEDLYDGYHIRRIPAKRMINCNGSGRGTINELIITNYPVRKR